MANSSSSVSTSHSARLVGSCLTVRNRLHRRGEPSSRITSPILRRSTSSSCPPLPSACSSSSCPAASPPPSRALQRDGLPLLLLGLRSRSSRLFPTIRRRASSSAIATIPVRAAHAFALRATTSAERSASARPIGTTAASAATSAVSSKVVLTEVAPAQIGRHVGPVTTGTIVFVRVFSSSVLLVRRFPLRRVPRYAQEQVCAFLATYAFATLGGASWCYALWRVACAYA